jgi:transposase InsO family protein
LPSRSTIARILDREHLVERNKRKRPKRSHRSIRSEYPNQRWQSDGLEVTLSTGEVVTVIEIIDDCTRFSVGLHPGPAENSTVVVDAFRIAIETYGRPVLVHTDNGSAFNQSRTGKTSALESFLADLGVKTITGRPSHPQSQGKVERAHRTLLAFIAARDPATVEQLQQLLDEYRVWFNHHRSHQALPPRTAPADLYETMPKVAPPGDPITPKRAASPVTRERSYQGAYDAILQHRVVGPGGRIRYLMHVVLLGKAWTGQRVTLLRHDDRVEIFDVRGERMVTTPWPKTTPTTSLARQITHTPPPTEESTMS